MIPRLILLVLLVVGCIAPCANAQLAGTAGIDYASHGWVIAQVPGEEQATLVHIPPRVPTGKAMPSPGGRLKAAASLSEAPSFLAADGASVYMVFAPEDDGSHQVAQLSVIPTTVRDNWVRQPSDRLRFLPAITGVDAVLGLAVDNGVLTALATEGRFRFLLELGNTGWERREFESQWSETLVSTMSASEQGLHIIEHLSDTVVLHSRTDDTWMRTVFPVQGAMEYPLIAGMRIIGVYHGEVIGVVRNDPRSEVWSFGVDGPIRLGTIDPPGIPLAGAILQSTGRLVLVWTNAGERTEEIESDLSAPNISNPVRRVIEFSLIEGKPLYTGQAVARSPVSVGEFRHLALLMMLLMGLVLLLVLRPPPEGDVIVLPPGLAIAGPGKRLMATILDGLVGLFIVSRVMDLSLLETLGPLAVPATGRLDVFPLVLALMVNVFHCSVGEAVFGRSIGKAINGLIVARVDKSAKALPAGQFRPPTPMRALARNMIKWFVPPVSMLVLTDPSGRHRGDLLARSAVLCRAAPPLSDH
ncbi:MAG: hypothetical protein COB69_03805 [Phycisphaera sp.]|nr:MAG: hypothetical protein COB69_03805 [Phycisphaera sp.]